MLFIDATRIFQQVDRAHREWIPSQIDFLANIVRLYRGEELDFTLGGQEAQSKFKEIFGRNPQYADIAGLCKAATINDIKEKDWRLTPSSYVGTALGGKISDEDFVKQFRTLNDERETLDAQARALEKTIAANVASLLEV